MKEIENLLIKKEKKNHIILNYKKKGRNFKISSFFMD